MNKKTNLIDNISIDKRFSDFLSNPSNASKKILDIANTQQNRYDYFLKQKSFLKSIVTGVKLRLMYMNKYDEIYDYVSKFSIENFDFDDLINKLSEIFDYIALNNLILTYASLVEKSKPSKIETKEDRKLFYLKLFYDGKITKKVFNHEFGHYAINPFELKSIRFSEMSDIELKKISKLMKNFKPIKTITLENYMSLTSHKSGELFNLYSALREELKYVALIVISKLRFLLLNIQKDKVHLKLKKVKLNDIFDLEFDEIKKLID